MATTPIGMAAQPVSTEARPGVQNPVQPTARRADMPNYFSDRGVSDDDKALIIKTIATYRSGWMQDRQTRIRVWMKSVLMEKGVQCLGWDASSGAWFDALAEFRNSGLQQDGETVELEKWMNNITLMFKQVFVGNLTKAIPHSIVRPKNAEIPADNQTAKAAEDVIQILDRKNKVRKLLRSVYENLYTFGCYFRYTRPVLDGDANGYDEQNVFEDFSIDTPARMKCVRCGTETPMADMGGGMGTGSELPACPGCQSPLGPESYYAAGEGARTSLRVAGTQKIPRASVRQSIHSPLEVDLDPNVSEWWKSPTLSKDNEIDFGEALKLYPAFREQIKAGATVSTTPNAEFEKLQRTQMKSASGGYASDLEMARPTHSENWLQPAGYYKLQDYAFAERMEKSFPEGMMVTTVGEVVVDIRPAVMRRDWSHGHLYEGYGPYCPSIAERVVPFNLRFNQIMQTLDDASVRTPTGLNVMDAARLDSEKMDKIPLPPGHIIGIPMRVNGEARPISETFAHFDLPINGQLWSYPQMLLTFCELIAGLPPQAFGGGTQEGVDTLGGQEQMLGQATAGLQPYWENVKDECAEAAVNEIECARRLMQCGAMDKIWMSEKSRGAGYRNKMVDLSKMQGEVEVFSDEDQGLPTTPDELRRTFILMFKELTAGNPAAQQWFEVPENAQMAQSTMIPGSVLPTEAQTIKTEIDLQTLVTEPGKVAVNPDGSTEMQLPVEPSKYEQFETAKAIVQRFMLENCDLRNTDPDAWDRLGAYYDKLEDMDAQVAAEKAERQQKVTAASQPQKPGPDPNATAALQELQGLAKSMADRLGQLAMLDPMQTKGTANAQVSAANDVVKTALDATKLMAQ